jgi:hypothetical protein
MLAWIASKGLTQTHNGEVTMDNGLWWYNVSTERKHYKKQLKLKTLLVAK